MKKGIAVILVLAAALAGCQTAGPVKRPGATAMYPPGGLSLMVDVTGAEIHIDGAFWGNAVRPYPEANQFAVSSGKHVVAVKSPGYEAYESTVRIMPANTHSLVVNLRPLPGADAARQREEHALDRMFARSSELFISSDVGGAMVYVDGQLRGQVPTYPHERGFELSVVLPVGPHALLLKKEGYKEYRSQIYVNERNGTRLAIVMEPKEKAAE